MIEALAAPRHKEHAKWEKWIGEFNPEEFDIDQENRSLTKRFY
jgi:hypothetical protein